MANRVVSFHWCREMMLDLVFSRIFCASLSGGRGAFGMSGRKSGLASLQFSARTGSRVEDRTTSGASSPQYSASRCSLHTSHELKLRSSRERAPEQNRVATPTGRARRARSVRFLTVHRNEMCTVPDAVTLQRGSCDCVTAGVGKSPLTGLLRGGSSGEAEEGCIESTMTWN